MSKRKALFYWEDIADKYEVPTTDPDDSYPQVISRMTNKLKEVHFKPDTANQIEVLWLPGPRYSCDVSEKLWAFPGEAIHLIETEIVRCIQPQYVDFYLKKGWQNSQCLSTVLCTATILFLFQNVKELKISGGHYNELLASDKRSARKHNYTEHATPQMWGPETFFKFIKRLESHTEPECKILQKLESASVRWTTTSQTAFEFLEWLAALPAINSIHAAGISTQFMHKSPRNLIPRSSSLTRLELDGQINDTQTLQGILQGARSLECFTYHSSSKYEENVRVESNVRGSGVCSVLAEFCGHSLKKFQTNLVLFPADLMKLQRLTHLWAPLKDLPMFELPRSLEQLVLSREHPRPHPDPIKPFVEVLVHAKDQNLPSLKTLTLVYSCWTGNPDEAFGEWIQSATKDLAEVDIDFHCVNSFAQQHPRHCFRGEVWSERRPGFFR